MPPRARATAPPSTPSASASCPSAPATAGRTRRAPRAGAPPSRASATSPTAAARSLCAASILVEVGGTVAPFAGTGWDAEIIDDFHAQKDGFGFLPKNARNGLRGYMHGLFTRTIPRHLTLPQVEVEVVNTGADAMTVDDDGRPIRLPGGAHGAVLYRGPTSVCAAATTAEWGFGFRAFPFAGVVPRRFCFRIYSGHALEATLRMGQLWRGAHPVPKMHTWLLTSCKATFSRPVPFQMGGDRVGVRSEIDYGLAPEQVSVLDWRAIGSA